MSNDRENTLQTDEIHALIDAVTDRLTAMSRAERLAWFRKNMSVEPLDFIRESDGTTYIVRAFFSETATETLAEKAERILLKPR